MTERGFPIYGNTIPRILGRHTILERLRRGLSKPNPDHMMVIGPKGVGKTVIVNALVQELRDKGAPFAGVARWDLTQSPAANDEKFREQLCQHVCAALEGSNPKYAEYLRDYGPHPLEGLKDVLNELQRDNLTVLLVLDGLEAPLRDGRISSNVWDNLRELGQLRSLRYITVSRDKPHNLAPDRTTEVSEFWNIFDQTPVTVGCFNNDDLACFLNQLPEVSFSSGALTELLNWTNAFPPLLLSILNLFVNNRTREIDASHVSRAAADSFDSVERTVARLWNSLPIGGKETFLAVNEAPNKEIDVRGHNPQDIAQLVEIGFVVRDGNRLRRPCRLLSHFLERTDPGDSSLRRLFGTTERYLESSRVVLELRLAQLDGLDGELRKFLERAVRDLPESPRLCLSNIRNIVDQTLELVWAAEVPDKRIPSEWISTWRHMRERGVDSLVGPFPTGGQRMSLLRLMTGGENSGRVARYVTKSTYVLCNSAHEFGNFGQHRDGSAIQASTAYAAMTTCIELAASLLSDLTQHRTGGSFTPQAAPVDAKE